MGARPRRYDAAAQRSWRRNARGAAEIAGHLVAPWRRTWRCSWGARPDELGRSFPGDDLIPDPTWSCTHAISIDAPRAAAWPWIAQLGQEHGGFYSFERLENLLGCRVRNADRIVDEWQHPAAGDVVRLHPSAPPLHVALVDDGRSLVLHGAATDVATRAAASTDAPGPDNLWSFHLLDDGPGRCRLVERGRTSHGTSLAERAFFGTAVIEPIGFVMSREMLAGIKARAEHAGRHAGRDVARRSL